MIFELLSLISRGNFEITFIRFFVHWEKPKSSRYDLRQSRTFLIFNSYWKKVILLDEKLNWKFGKAHGKFGRENYRTRKTFFISSYTKLHESTVSWSQKTNYKSFWTIHFRNIIAIRTLFSRTLCSCRSRRPEVFDETSCSE